MIIPVLVLFVVGVERLTLGQEIGSECSVRGRNQGICTLLSDCDYVIKRIPKRRPYTRCGFQGRTEIVCCPSDQPSTTPITPKCPQPQYERISLRKCREYSANVYEYVKIGSTDGQPKTIAIDKCGHKVVPLVVGGEKANPREFPHMALLGFMQGENQISWSCGGTLLSENFVLTAGHCLNKDVGVLKFVQVGDLDISTATDDARPDTVGVAATIRHPRNSKSTKYNDIALIKLNRNVTFSPYVRPACLPSVFEGPEKQAIVTGWGNTKFQGTNSPHLLKVTLDKFPHAVCYDSYSDYIGKRLVDGIRNETQMCAGSTTESKDTCQGDSGGPIQVYHDQCIYCMYDIIGVTSFGMPCGMQSPGIYTRVYPYLDWIESIVWPNQ